MPGGLEITAPAYVREDWDDDGNFTGEYDDLADDLLPSLTVERGRDQGRIIGRPMVPRGAFRLNNESRRYATEYSGSPLFGKLRPGHRVELGRTIGSTTITMGDAGITMGDDEALMGGTADVALLVGYAEEQVERYGYGQRDVAVAAMGVSRRLVDSTISVPYQAAITTGAAMVLVWQAAGLVNGVDFEVDPDEITGGFTLLHWYVDGRSAWEATLELWATAGPPAAVYERHDGTLVFEGKTFRWSAARSTTVQATVSDTDATPLWHTDLEYSPSFDSIINEMRLTVERRQVAPSPIKVWEASGPLVIDANATLTMIASNTSRDPWTNVITPAVTTDYVVTAGSLVSLTATVLSPFAVLLTLVAGAGGATVGPSGANDGLQLRAQPVTVISTETAVGTIDTSESQTRYGVKGAASQLTASVWPGLSPADANGLIDGYLVNYPEPRALLHVTIEAASGVILYELIQREISDRLHVVNAWSGIALDVWVEQIRHVIEADVRHTMSFACERVVQLDWARWDVALWDVGRFGQ